MKFKIHIIFVISLLVFGLSFPTIVTASGGCPAFVPGDDACTKKCPCDEGQGDCDTDTDCMHGLTCVRNVGADYGWPKWWDVCKDTAPSRLIEIEVHTDFIRLGDEPLGTPIWETTVYISDSQLSSSNYAAIEFIAVHVWDGTSDNLIVNGRVYALPISEPLGEKDIPFRGKTVIPIPVGALHKGENTIGFESGPIDNPTNQWDDFWVGEIVLVLSR